MRILLAEDDETLNHSIKYRLEKEDFIVDSCFDGEEALYYIEQNIHDIVLLDRMLPRMDGTNVLQKVRSGGCLTPIILITALGRLEDKITGLDCGADDYLVKPFAFEELLARIRCVTRRPRLLTPDNTLPYGDIVLLFTENRLKGPSSVCGLSRKESELLEVLLRNCGQTIPRATLLTKVWGPESDVEDGNLDNYIHFLRRRLRSVGSSLQIRTVRGVGYHIEG